MADQTTWHRPGGPKETRKPQPLPCQGPMARKEGQTPLKFCPPGGTSRQRGPTKNGVLVPLPPWAKEPAAGAAELPRYVLSKDGKNQRSPGAGSEECKHSSRLPPDPGYGGRFPGECSATPARAVQLIDSASAPLPLAGRLGKACFAGRGTRAGCHQP